MEKNTATLIKGMADELATAVYMNDLYLGMYRDEKARADKLEVELKASKEPCCRNAESAK